MTARRSSPRPPAVRTVRDATLDVLCQLGLTTFFGNPGSTEVPFLADLPEDFRFVLGLHEGSVVGMATGWALARQRPAFVVLHTVAGLGNAVGALATARQNRAPLVVLVGQQDRRHLALDPFLAGRLDDLAGSYPVSVDQPVRAEDVPGAVARAYYRAGGTPRGPAVIIVPMDDWDAPLDHHAAGPVVPAAPRQLVRAAGVDAAAAAGVAERLSAARSPALVVGAGADDAHTWAALGELVDRLGAPVWQEPFGARAGFPQDRPWFAGHLPAGRGPLRETLAGHDVVLVVGAPVFRQYPYEPGPLLPPGTAVVQLCDDPAQAYGSPTDLAVVTPLPGFLAEVAARVPRRDAPRPEPRGRPAPAATASGAELSPAQLYGMLAERLAADTVVVEETPSSRPTLQAIIPARAPLGFLSAAGGGLGFALPAAIGVRLALPDRPVVCVVGDGSSLYAIQALWSATRYQAGVLFIVLANGGYAIMDRLVEQRRQGARVPWPHFPEVQVARLAEALGCPGACVATDDELARVLDDVVPTLAGRDQPLLVQVAVRPDPSYHS